MYTIHARSFEDFLQRLDTTTRVEANARIDRMATDGYLIYARPIARLSFHAYDANKIFEVVFEEEKNGDLRGSNWRYYEDLLNRIKQRTSNITDVAQLQKSPQASKP